MTAAADSPATPAQSPRAWWQRGASAARREERAGGRTGDSTVRVSTWTELDEALTDWSWAQRPHQVRPTVIYRGAACAEWPAETSLARLGGSFVDVEAHLVDSFRKYSYGSLEQDASTWDWLSLAQHHGLPTRLLDWTFSPYIALHFATASVRHWDSEGAVWAVDYERVHELLPETLRSELGASSMFTTATLERGAADLRALDELGAQDPLVVFFEPPSLDQRIVTQAAVFSVISAPDARMDDWLARHPTLWRKIVFPAALKPEIRDRLDQANVTERVLFPGLDGLALWLARYYGERGPGGQHVDTSGQRRLPGVATKSA